MAMSGLANGESAPVLKAESHVSKARRSFRRRRSRSWHFEGWESRPAPPRILPTFGAATPPASGPDAVERPLRLERSGGFPEREEMASVGVSPWSRKWLSFFGKRVKKSSISISTGSLALARGGGRDEGGGVARAPYVAREVTKAGTSRDKKAAAVAAVEEEGGSGAAASRKLSMERPQLEEQKKLPAAAAAGSAGGKAAAAERGKASAPESTLPTYEEARRRTQQQEHTQEQEQERHGGEAGAATPAAGFASPPAANIVRCSDANSMQGRRRDSSGVSLRRGGARTTTSLEPGARVLCLDIFVSAIGEDEIRQWRPAEVGFSVATRDI